MNDQAVVYKTSIISTIVDMSVFEDSNSVYKTSIISTIVDVDEAIDDL